MTSPQHSEPSDLNFVFERDGDTITFIRPGAGAVGAIIAVILLSPLALPILIQWIFILALLHRDGEVELVEVLGTLALCPFYISFHYFGRECYEYLRQSRVRTSKKQLLIEVPHGFRMIRSCFTPAEIRALDAWNSLRIATQDGRVACFFEEAPNSELAWMAQVVRQHLGVPADIPPKPGELAVDITGSFWDVPVKIVLSARPGKLVLRHSMCRWPFLVFRAHVVEQYRLVVHGAIPLLPHHLTILTDEEGAPYLLIVPDGVKASYERQHGACLRLHVEGCLLPTTMRLSECHPLTGPQGKEGFWIAIWHEDRASLQRALACFHGAADQ